VGRVLSRPKRPTRIAEKAKLNCKSQPVRPATLLLDPTPVFLGQQPVPNHLPSAKKMVGRL